MSRTGQVVGDFFVGAALPSHRKNRLFDLFGPGQLLESTNGDGGDRLGGVAATPNDTHCDAIALTPENDLVDEAVQQGFLLRPAEYALLPQPGQRWANLLEHLQEVGRDRPAFARLLLEIARCVSRNISDEFQICSAKYPSVCRGDAESILRSHDPAMARKQFIFIGLTIIVGLSDKLVLPTLG